MYLSLTLSLALSLSLSLSLPLTNYYVFLLPFTLQNVSAQTWHMLEESLERVYQKKKVSGMSKKMKMMPSKMKTKMKTKTELAECKLIIPVEPYLRSCILHLRVHSSVVPTIERLLNRTRNQIQQLA
jgi:hypothetical protein